MAYRAGLGGGRNTGRAAGQHNPREGRAAASLTHVSELLTGECRNHG
jgi:hypothetical protein